jgi:hypothetical protein
MKSTDIAKKDRELKRAEKHQEGIDRLKTKKDGMTVGDYIDKLAGLFFHDGAKIYNISKSAEIKQLLEDVKLSIPDKQWDNILRKSLKKTGIAARESAYDELKKLFDSLG